MHGGPSPEEQDDGTLLASGTDDIREIISLRGAFEDKYMLVQYIHFQGRVFAKMPGST
ncbi:hypothetical protein AB07_2399 [Citrobacter freundii]|nr:hypothetical protein AB07_2399 [Citrobacter freundii]